MTETNRIEYKREVTSELDIEKVTFFIAGWYCVIIFNFAKRGLSEELIETMNKECFEYEQTYFDSIKEHIDNLIYLEEKYI